jgi:hypothetical protein
LNGFNGRYFPNVVDRMRSKGFTFVTMREQAERFSSPGAS